MAVGLRARHRKHRAGRILDAAAQLFREVGYEKTSIEAVAEAAAVAPATVYNYFSSKQNLLMELALRHVRLALPDRQLFINSPPDDVLAGITGFERLLAAQAMRHLTPECYRVIFAANLLDPDGRAARAGAKMGRMLRLHYARMFRIYRDRGVLPETVSIALLARQVVEVTSWNFARHVCAPGGRPDTNRMLRDGDDYVRVLLAGTLSLAREPAAQKL